VVSETTTFSLVSGSVGEGKEGGREGGREMRGRGWGDAERSSKGEKC
jgi:hypothetical protein